MKKLILLTFAFLLTFAVNAQKVIFPQEQQAGTASSSVSDGTYTLANNLLTATFIHADGKLTFGGCAAMGLQPSEDLFSIRLGDGTEVASSSMTLNGVSLVTLTPDATAAKASLKLPGRALEATYTSGDLQLTWRAVLRDGSHYLRTELELTAVADVAMNAIIPMHYTVDNTLSEQAPAVVGNTRGAVIASDKIFAGLETPMGKNSIVGNISTGTFAYGGWTGTTFDWEPGSETPQGILDLGLPASGILGKQGYLAILEGGPQTVTFQYTSGDHRLDIAGVDIVNLSGTVVASDYHKGYTGGAKSNNVYTLNIPEPGFYLVRYFRDTVTDPQTSFNSNGTITWSCAVVAPELLLDGNMEANVLPAIESSGDTNLSDSWTSSSWSEVSAVPAGVTALDNSFTTSNIMKKEMAVNFVSGGTLSATLTYSGGSHRLNIVGVDLLDGEGTVVASDYHSGYTGDQHSSNTYSFSVPAAGDYTLRYLCETKTEDITSSGNIAITFSAGTPVFAVGGTRTDTWNTSSWSVPESVPARINELGYTSDRIKVMTKTVRFGRAGGTFSAQFMYASGDHGLTIAGVDLIDGDNNNVAVSDYHNGFSGTAKTANTYSFVVPAAGSYTIRYFVVLNPSGNDNTSSGNINLSYAKTEYLHLPAPTSTEFKGEWSRQTTLAAGKTWKVGAVVGLIAPGQARRSFLCYSERERAVPWRAFPMYNSWFELNINRNNDQNYTGNFNESQCAEVLSQWKTHLFDNHGVGIGSFVWDDGWDEYGTWEFNPNFPDGFQNLSNQAWSMDSQIGAWLGPVGGYGTSGNYRRSYWNSKGGMQLSNPDYYNVFLDRTSYMLNNYHFNYFKFDGISAQFSATGPDAGAAGEENAEAIIDIELKLREVKPDVFFNTSVGTWASPFWFQATDAVWRQENDWGTIGGQGNTREQWITYRDRLVYQNFVQNSPLCPINCLMTHGFILTNYGSGAKDMSQNYDDIVREMRCAFACGSGMVEVYADFALMNSINGGALWGDLAECIKWQKAQEDVLPDVHWVGGNPWDGSKANVYGWASWNGEKATLALRNPAASAQTFTTTLREALDIPAYIHTSITLTDAFTQGTLTGLTTGTPIDIDETLTLTLAASSVYIYNSGDEEAQVEKVLSVGEKANTMTPATSTSDDSHWYLVTQIRYGESVMYDAGAGQTLRRGSTAQTAASFNGKHMSEAENYLVRFLETGTAGVYNIQFANGRYITSDLNTGATPGNYFFYNINNEAGHFGWNLTTDGTTYGSRVDNNGATYTLAFWGNGTVTGSGGNNDWYIYPVEIVSSANYNVVVTGAPSGGGVVFGGTTYQNGGTLKAPIDLAANALTVVNINGYTGLVSISGTTITVTYYNNTVYTWYTIKNHNGAYLSLNSNYTDASGNLILTNTTEPTDQKALWRVEDQGNGTVRFYNYTTGPAKVLGMSGSDANARALMVDASLPANDGTYTTYFSFYDASKYPTGEASYIRMGSSGNNYWNKRGNYLALWNSGGAVGDNGSTFYFQRQTVHADADYFSTSAENANYFGLKFKAGTVYVGDSENLGDLLVTEGVFKTTWALIGDASGFKLLNRNGRYVGVKNVTNDFCYTVATADEAMEFILISNSDGSFEIARKSNASKTFNPWGGMSAGRNIGFWNAGDNSNKLVLIDEAEMPIYDYRMVSGGTRPSDISTLSLWYDFPATLAGSAHPWMEYGLPIGNGQIGATLLGGVKQDEIILNEKTLYNGSPTDWGEHGKYACLGKILVDDLSGIGAVLDNSKPISDYTRYLDIEKGVAGVDFTSSTGTHYSRRYIVSAPHRVMAARYVADGDDPLHLRFSYEPDAYINASAVSYSGNSGTFNGELKTVSYSTEMRVMATGGTVTTTAEGIEVDGASEVVLYMTAATNFDDSTPTFINGSIEDVAIANGMLLAAASSEGWTKVYNDHVAQFSELMGRVNLQLGNAASTMVTKDLVDNYATEANRTNADGLFLEQLYFQYGRYLEISCNNVLINAPANLQGIWNDDSNTNFWHCDIHTDVNVQMNYWPAEITNLSTMHLPFLNNIISNAGDDYNFHTVAQRYRSGVRGWMVPTETNIFGGTSTWYAFQIKSLAAWNCSHLWQHYRYTLDRDFLRRALPAMLTAAQFLKDISTQAGDGTYYVADEYSPEHGPSGHSTAFAQQNTSEVVRSVIEGAEALGTDSPISAADLQEMRDFWEVLDKGLHTETYNGKTCLSEWADLTLNSQGDAAGHRHLSHLMALYPYSQVSAYAKDDEGKALYEAAVNSLLVRNATDVTGWSGGWKVNLFARALRGDDARDVFALMLKHSNSYVIAMSGQGGCYYNLWDAHSPFQIDGNFGYTSGVAEMLLQSYDGNIHLLPAMPSAWTNGSITGLKAVGDFTVDQAWADGKLTAATITSGKGQKCTVGYPGIAKATVTSAGVRVDVEIISADEITFNTQEGASYEIDMQHLIIRESDTTPATAAANVDVTLERTLIGDKWQGFSIPFSLTEQQIADSPLAGMEIATLDNAVGNTLNFAPSTAIEAGKPYFVRPADDVENPVFEQVNITVTEPESIDAGGYAFVAQLYKADLPLDGSVAYLSTATGKLKRLTSGGLAGLRSYLLLPVGVDVRLNFIGTETGITLTPGANPSGDATIYTLDGLRHSKLVKGVNIVNGKKIVK